MALTTNPVAITTTAAVTLTPPSNAPWAEVVLDNLSPYLLSVQVGGSVEWLAPWTENVYTATSTHAPVVVSAQSAAGGATLLGAQIQATWFAPGENLPDTRQWPMSLTANAVAAASPPPQTLFQSPGAVGGGTTNVTLPPTTRTLLVYGQTVTGSILNTVVAVQGGNTAFNYRQSIPPYLQAGIAWFCVVEVAAGVDPVVAVFVSTTGGTNTFTVAGDSTPYPESVFYNGTPAAHSSNVAGATTLATGPCRLLTSDLNIGTGGGASLSLGATFMASASPGITAYPEPFIVPSGVSLIGNVTAPARVSITTAYP